MLPKKLFFRVLFALFVGACLVVVLSYLNFLGDLKSFQSLYKAFHTFSGEVSSPELESISRKGRLLLQGNEEERDDDERWRALHREEPDNPAYYSLYLQKIRKIPENFDQVVQSIDPENGWFQFFKIAMEAETLVSWKSTSKPQDSRDEKRYEIEDEESFEKAISDLEVALNFPRFTSYTKDLSEEQFSVIAVPEDYVSNLNKIFGLGAALDAGALMSRPVIKVLTAALERAHTEARFTLLERISIHLIQRSEAELGSMVDILLVRAIRKSLVEELSLAAKRLGLDEKASFYEKQKEMLFSSRKKLEVGYPNGARASEVLGKHGSIFVQSIGPPLLKFAVNEPTFSVTDFRPGQRNERAYFSQAFYIHAFMVISFTIVFLLVTSRKMASDENPKSTMKLLMKAVVLPFLILVLGRYFLSFGVLDFGAWPTKGLNYLLFEMATFQLLLAVILCWYRSKIFSGKYRFRCWWPVILTMLSYVGAIAMPHFPVIGSLVIGLVAIQTIWLFAIVGIALSKNMSEGLAKERRSLAYAFMTLAILIGLSIVGLEREKSYWFENIELEKATPHSLTLLEEKIVEVAKAELAELPSFIE